MLDRRCVEVGADLHKESLARIAVGFEHADLHELVRSEIAVDFMQHRSRKPVRADGDDRLQVMRFRAKRPPLRG